MKKTILLLLLIPFFTIGQTQDLAGLAKGDYLGFNAVYDQKEVLFGYVALYGYGKSGEKTKKFEYVLLDKNLNPVANKEFDGDITASDYYAAMDFKEDIILYPTGVDNSLIKNRELFSPSSMVINLKENTIKRKVYYDYKDQIFNEINEPKVWKEERKEDRKEKKENGFNYRSYVYEIKEGGYLAIEYNSYGSYVNNNSLIKFSNNKKEIWRYKYNTNGTRKIYEYLEILEKDEKYIYCLKTIVEKDEKYFSIVVLDMVNGQIIKKIDVNKLNKQTLESITSLRSVYKSIDNDKTFDDKIVLVGRSYNSNNENDGFARLMINKITLEVEEWQFYFLEMKKYFPEINFEGKIEKGYYLVPKDIFFLKDGSVGLLFEKYKPEGSYSAPKTTDLVYVFTDERFAIKGVKVFEKEKTKWSNADYLFSQYINDGNDVVFFYRDLQKDKETREKKWNLFINTLISGEFKQEQIPISEKDNFFMIPYVAKEGYILLREFNEKEKYNKIRLEKLNY